MPKKAYLASHLSAFELKRRYRQSKNSIESRRWHLLWKISQGWTIKNSAAAVGISYGYAQRIVRSDNQHGIESVKVKPRREEKHTRGKAALLSEEQLQKLAQAWESKPSDGGIWTGVKVARWIEKETGQIGIWNQREWDYLKKCPKGLASRCTTPGKDQDENITKPIFKSKAYLSKIFLF